MTPNFAKRRRIFYLSEKNSFQRDIPQLTHFLKLTGFIMLLKNRQNSILQFTNLRRSKGLVNLFTKARFEKKNEILQAIFVTCNFVM
jgi:hypothetical protein